MQRGENNEPRKISGRRMNWRGQKDEDVVVSRPLSARGLVHSLSINTFLPVPARMNDHSPSPADIQSHVFSALLQGTTPDIALRVRGSWSAVYKLHRLILTQSVSLCPAVHSAVYADRFRASSTLSSLPVS